MLKESTDIFTIATEAELANLFGSPESIALFRKLPLSGDSLNAYLAKLYHYRGEYSRSEYYLGQINDQMYKQDTVLFLHEVV